MADDDLEAERQKIRDMQNRIESHKREKKKVESAAKAAKELHRKKTLAVVKLGRFFMGKSSKKK